MFKTFFSLIIWPIWYAFFIPSLLLLFIAILIFPKKLLHYFVRPICWLYCFFAGQWLRRINNPPKKESGPYLYMFNHVSMFDQFMIGAYIPYYITAIAAIEVFNYPIFGFIIKKYENIKIIYRNKAVLSELKKMIYPAIKII